MSGAFKKLTSMGKDQWKELFIQNAIIIVIFFIIVGIIIKDPNFVSIDVLRNILTQSSVRLILAFGVGGLIIIQGTDLSLGRIVGFAAIISASLLQAPDYTARFYPNLPQLPLIVPLLASCLVCALASGISGWVCAKYKIHPFLATLGMMVSIYGVLSIYFASGAPGPQPIGGHAEYYKNFVIGTTFGIPNLVIYAGLVTVVVWFLWNKTTFGKNLYAIGGNPEAAKVSGVNVAKTTILAFLLAGVLYGIGGFLEAARIGSANNGTGYGYEMDAIAACVVGGVSFLGGIGKVSGVVVGVLLFTIINYGMTFIGLDQYYQYIIKGVIIVAAVALDAQKYIKKS